MADPLEWFAMDSASGGVAQPVTPVLEEPPPNVAIYARAPGLPSPIVWTAIWEPVSIGAEAPQRFVGGPLAVGQAPTVPTGGGVAAVYVPNDPDVVGVINFWELGVLRLLATANGAAVPGELRMVLSYSGSAYPDVALSYEGGAVTDVFWTQHQGTYEIP